MEVLVFNIYSTQKRNSSNLFKTRPPFFYSIFFLSLMQWKYLPFNSISSLTRSCLRRCKAKNKMIAHAADQAMMTSTPSKFQPNARNASSFPFTNIPDSLLKMGTESTPHRPPPRWTVEKKWKYLKSLLCLHLDCSSCGTTFTSLVHLLLFVQVLVARQPMTMLVILTLKVSQLLLTTSFCLKRKNSKRTFMCLMVGHLPATASKGSSTFSRSMEVLQATYANPAMTPMIKAA